MLEIYLAQGLVRMLGGAKFILLPNLLIGSVIREEFYGLFLSSYTLAEALTGIPAGILVEKFGPHRVVPLAAVIHGISTATLAVTDSVVVGIVANAVAGVSAALLTTSFLAMAIGESEISRRGLQMGGFEASNILGYVAGMGAGTLIASLLDPVRAMLIASLFPLLAAVISRPRKVRVRGGEFATSSRDVLPIIPLWLSTTVLIGTIFSLPRHLDRVRVEIPEPLRGVFESGGRVQTVGVSMVALMLAGLLLIVLAGYVSDRIGRFRALYISNVGMVAFLVTLSFTYSKLFNYLPIIAPLAFLAAMLAPSLVAAMGDLAYKRGYASGLYSAVLGVGLSIGQSATSAIIVFGGFDWLLRFLAMVFAVSGAYTLTRLRRVYAHRG